jgi:hypothetical protein
MVPGPTYVDTNYVCAEVDNEMVEPENIESLSNMFYEASVRNTYLQWRLDQSGITIEEEDTSIAKEADTLPLDEIEKQMSEDEGGKIALEFAKKAASEKADSFRIDPSRKLEGVDVADGAAYISDEMAEILLKQVGNYGKEIQKAFEILRNPKETTSIREMAEAYDKVHTAVIGTQKYTAYGFRFRNGVQYVYYNKMALFPMFKCICTGKMANIYQKMKGQKIDMLMVNSAVKAGSQGCKPIKWDDYR